MGPGSKEIDQDALLVAYLDGELEPALRLELEQRLQADSSLRERLSAIAGSDRDLRGCFEALIEAAPRERLDRGYAAALAPPRRRTFSARDMMLAAAAALLLLIGGVTTGYYLGQSSDLSEDADSFEDAWIDAVAGQLRLYEGNALAFVPADEADHETLLAKVGQALKVDFSPPNVAVEGLTLQRVELLNFKGRQIAELLYTSKDHGPIAFCIAAAPGESREEGEQREVESRDGLNLTYWSDSGRRFLVIGAAPPERIKSLGDTLSERFGT